MGGKTVAVVNALALCEFAQLGEVDGLGGEVLRYGIELMDWNAAWWADLERRLS